MFFTGVAQQLGEDPVVAGGGVAGGGAGLEQQRREYEEVLAAHQSDLHVGAPPQDALEVSHGRDAAESTAENDNAHVTGYDSTVMELNLLDDRIALAARAPKTNTNV